MWPFGERGGLHLRLIAVEFTTSALASNGALGTEKYGTISPATYHASICIPSSRVLIETASEEGPLPSLFIAVTVTLY